MPITSTAKARLITCIEAAGSERGEWLTGACAAQRSAPADDLADTVSLHWAMARRRLGAEPLPGGHDEPLDDLDTSRWSVGDAGRVVLLLDALEGAAEAALPLVRAVYRAGDEAERAALVRALALLQPPAAYRDIALEAGRANSLLLFGALAERNPYPAAVYTEPEFNQLVLKCIFTGISIANVVGLETRANAELARMAEDFHDERCAAGRPVPPDMWLAMAPHGSARARRLVFERLTHDDPAHRYFAAAALGWHTSTDAHAADALRAAAAGESDARVRATMQASLALTAPQPD
ncbi:MAG: EboA domain-containing protein [Pseudomonadota bacterium]